MESNKSSELTVKKSKKSAEKSDKEKLTDINNIKSYAAAYPYGGLLSQKNPHLGINGNMTPLYPGSFEFGSLFHGFSPILAGPTPQLHRQSLIPPIEPSLILNGSC